MSKYCFGLVGVLLLVSFFLVGCSLKAGRYVDNSQFVYPNSNIKMLGPVCAKKTKWMVFLGPSLNLKDVKKVYNNALSQCPGANIIVNYTEDSTQTSYFLVNTLKYEIRGNAAHMEVGEQKLR